MKKIDKPVLPKFTIAEMDLFDVPMVGVFKNKEYTAYTLSTLAGIEIDNLDDMEITVEDFMANPEEGKRNMRMDARINLRGNIRADIEIQKFRNKDELERALYYLGGLLVDFSKGIENIPQTRSIVVFICDFDPFKGTPYEGVTRMRYTLKSEDDSDRFNTIGGEPYPFEGVNVLIYNGKKVWSEENPRSDEEEAVRVYLEDMQKADPRDMKSSVAANAVSEYKGDPKIMDKTKKWVEETFKERMEELNEDHRKKMNAQKEEYENKLSTQKDEYEDKLNLQKDAYEDKLNLQKDEYEEKIDAMISNLISIGMDDENISEIAKVSVEGLLNCEKRNDVKLATHYFTVFSLKGHFGCSGQCYFSSSLFFIADDIVVLRYF